MKKRILSLTLCALMAMSLLAACAQKGETGFLSASAPPVEIEYLEDEAVALAETAPALPLVLSAQQGDKSKSNGKAAIDYSHTEDGYVMALVKKDTGKRWKAQVKGPTTTYTYNLTAKEWAVFPFSDGNGDYKITLYENVSGSKYASVLSLSCTVTLKDEFGPFLYPNQYVNYDIAVNAVAKAAELTAGSEKELDKVAAVYDYVVETLSYDKELARTVQSGYLPVLDSVLEKQKGICFDYAALMTGMLRSQNVPCKLVVGYAGTAYHAWISVWTEEQGWIDNVIFFNGSAWQRMDPTFASSGGKSPAILKYIGDGSNYTAKYFY